MTEIQIPHEHEVALRKMKTHLSMSSPAYIEDLLDDLIAAAMADAPTPPEMVAYRHEDGDERVLYRQPDGRLTVLRSAAGVWFHPDHDDYNEAISRCTPLVPTVNADGLEKATIRYVYNDVHRVEWGASVGESSKNLHRRWVRKIFHAAGVAVEGDETDGGVS